MKKFLKKIGLLLVGSLCVEGVISVVNNMIEMNDILKCEKGFEGSTKVDGKGRIELERSDFTVK